MLYAVHVLTVMCISNLHLIIYYHVVITLHTMHIATMLISYYI